VCAKARLFGVSEREVRSGCDLSEAIDIVKREAGDVAEVQESSEDFPRPRESLQRDWANSNSWSWFEERATLI
jgi:hypothetical protein